MASGDVDVRVKLVDQLSGTAKTVAAGIERIGTVASSVTSKLSSLAGPLVALAAPIITVATALKSISAAAEAAAGENKLRAVLQNNNALLQARLKVADELSAKSIFDNDAFIAAETSLRNLGVSSAKIDRALEASRQLASATGTSLADAATNWAERLTERPAVSERSFRSFRA